MAEVAPTDSSGTARRPPGGVDVARLASVSQKTVSRVMNNEPHVSPAVRSRVLDAAHQLGYRRNTAARALNLGRFQRIGVVSLGSSLYGPATLLAELERAVRDTAYSLSVVSTVEGQPHAIADAIDSLLSQGVDGVVLSEPIDEGQTVRLDVPVVSFGELVGLDGPSVDVTGLDGAAASRVATEHLLSLGHRTVWHVSGRQGFGPARDRASGWLQALAAGGAPEPPVLDGDWTPASGYAAGVALARTAGVTAVFAANDEMAIGVIRALNDAGLAVPERVSVVGFDDIPVAAYVSPPLTTIRQDFAVMAARALALLIERIDGRGEPPEHDDLPIELVVRKSTASPPNDHRPDDPTRRPM
jgi:DNA-binding LacI/PurR family transcriptional regulator